MPKKTAQNTDEQLERHFRHSLQPKSSKDIADIHFRHTQSQRYETTGKKKDKKTRSLTPIPDTVEISIPEEAELPKRSRSKIDIDTNLERKASKTSRTSKSSKRSEADKSTYAFQNQGFDDRFDKRSITSTRAGSSRTSSVQSLEIVREQYCCFAKRTRCERKLIITVAVLILVIIVLIFVIVVIGSKQNIRDDIKVTFLGL